MKYLRLLLRLLLLVFTVAALLVALAFVPAVQTWLAEMQLAKQPGVQVSIGSLSARFGKLDATDVHLEYGGAVLTLPTLQAALPLQTAAVDGKYLIQSLVAKGWTLDLSHVPALAEALTQISSPSTAAIAPGAMITGILGGILNGWNPPGEVTLDGVDLEGDVLVITPYTGRDPVKVHVSIKGGGLLPGHEGVFVVEAAGVGLDANNQPVNVASHGRAAITVSGPRTYSRVAVSSEVSVQGGSLPGALTVAANVTADRTTHEESGALELRSGDRTLVHAAGRYALAAQQLEGTWKIEVRDSDVAPFLPDRHLPSASLAGEGNFDADAALSRVHARGRLLAGASQLGVIAPALERAGALTLETHFDFVRSGHSLRFDQLSASLTGAKPIASAQSLQPFTLDETTGVLTVTDPQRDSLAGAIQGFPLGWLAGLADGLAINGDDVTGEFTAQIVNGGFSVHGKSPFVARNVSVQNGGSVIAQNLELSFALLADYTHATGWQMQAAPLTISHAGHRLALIEGKLAHPAGTDQPITLAGKWTADLAVLVSAQPALENARWIPWRSGLGDFSVSLGASTKVDGTVALTGHEPGHSLTANVSAEFADNHEVTFHVPMKIAVGPSHSDLTLEGTIARQDQGGTFDLHLSGETVVANDLRLLFAPLLLHAAGAGDEAVSKQRDAIPFWGEWMGSVSLGFDHVKLDDDEIKDIRANLDVDHRSIRLENGLFARAHGELSKAEGSLAFDPAVASPYQFKVSAALGDVEGASWVAAKPAKPAAPEPLLEGKFSVTAAMTGTGVNLGDLAAHTQEEFRVTSRGGALRLLKTSVSGLVAEASTPVADTLGTAGALVGHFFGFKGSTLQSGEIKLPKNTEAVLDFTYRVAEIPFEGFAFTAIRDTDGTTRITDLVLTSPDFHLTGSGQFDGIEGKPLRAQPLTLNLELGVRNSLTALLKPASLLSERKDSLGYTLFNEPLHFSGTLEEIDSTQWHGLLVEAAKPKPPEKEQTKSKP